MTDIEKYTEKNFENIKRYTKSGAEFWLARELQEALEYKEWRNFVSVIEKAKIACDNSNNDVNYHFVDVNKMVIAGVSQKEIDDIALTRYACYLIVQNGDSRKRIIALGQTYFAIKTRQQEVTNNYDLLTENEQRIAIRQDVTKHNKSLAESARNAGVIKPLDFAIFQNEGYKGLYGGLGTKEIHKKKGLNKNQAILDHMSTTELAANLFRATQADEKLRRDNVKGKDEANQLHKKVGQKVRDTIEELGGTMPENLPTPEKSIKQLVSEKKKNQLPKK